LPEEIITVTDPRHPLFGRSLPLLGITSQQHQGQYCILSVYKGILHLVPLAATDRAIEPPVTFPLPMDLASVQNLVALWKSILEQTGEKARDEITYQPAKSNRKKGHDSPNPRRRRRSESQSNLDATDTNPAAESEARHDPGGRLSGEDAIRRQT
jgi:hypothetical protein